MIRCALSKYGMRKKCGVTVSSLLGYIPTLPILQMSTVTDFDLSE
jgi:hypothetical protein